MKRWEELTLRGGEEGTLRTFRHHQCGVPPLVDEDWHAVCQAMYSDVEGAEWEKLCCKCVEPGRAVHIRHPSTSHKAKTLWKVREAKAKGDAFARSGQRAGTVGKTPAETRRRLRMKPCEGGQWWWTVRSLPVREEAEAECEPPLSPTGRSVVSEVL